VIMVEGGANELPEEVMLEAIARGHQAMLPLIEMQKDLAAEIGREKLPVPSRSLEESVLSG